MTPPRPHLFASAETVAEATKARAIVFLIGGYDGSGNYGDLAQLDATLALLGDFEPDLLLLPVLERSRLADHRRLEAEFLHRLPRAVFFNQEEGDEDGLLPLPAPADLTFVAYYLYGGGYLNPSWGERKLGMLRAAEALVNEAGASEACRLSSGLQIDAGWISDLAADDLDRLRSFELLGVRDPASGEALLTLGSEAPVVNGGDDAIGMLRRIHLRESPPDRDGLLLNVHLAEHPWITAWPDSIAGFFAALAAGIGAQAGLSVTVRPLIAYVDRHVNDATALERLARVCQEKKVKVAEPQVLRPARLVGQLNAMRCAAITLSCSYHVALTSLMVGVPAILLRDTAYYDQKASGLEGAFDLPAEFEVSSASDPNLAAEAIATIVLDRRRAEDLQRQLDLAGSRLREIHAATEIELLSRLGSAASAALAAKIGELSERLRERSREPAELMTKISLLQSESGVPPAMQEDFEAQAMLEKVTGSRSWRLTAPLRRIGSLLRRG
jgi:polysaccharide pyruvyl transferase WcaK-like protein